MADLNFHFVPDPEPDGPEAEVHPSEQETLCDCGTLDGLWDLSYDQGIQLVHRTCGKNFGAPDWEEFFYFESPVTLSLDQCSDPGGWHGLTRCDCGSTFVATPVVEP